MPTNNLTVQQSTLDFLKEWEGYQPKMYNDSEGYPTIGIGFLLAKPASNFLKVTVDTGGVWDGYKYKWRGKNLQTALLTPSDSIQLVKDYSDFLYGGNGISARINKIFNNLGLILTQDQFDALFSLFFNVSYSGKTAKNLEAALYRYGTDLILNKENLKQQWTYIDPSVSSKSVKGLYNRRKAEFDLFYSQLQPRSTYKYEYARESTNGSKVFINKDKTYYENIGKPIENEIPQRNLQDLFDEIDLNLKNIEQDQTDADWGAKSNEKERSAWVSLKGYILYLCSRYAPHVLVPFVELIPQYQMDESHLNQLQDDSRKNIDKVVQDVSSKYLGSLDAQSIKSTRQRIEQAAEKIPGYNETRYNNQVKQFNNLSGKADLFNLDPFQEDFISINGEKSKSGKASYAKKNVGVRIYGQVVLSPGAEDDELSKAGAIGFEELNIKQGKGQMNALTLVELKLRDVQGNKFTDINSPWNFLFDARPGTTSGDFLMRYGWALQLPAYDDIMAKKFWSHPGWKVFGDVIKNKLKSRARNQQELILVQSLVTDTYNNNGSIDIAKVKQEHQDYQTGSTTASGFMSISLVNPSIETAEDGSLLATIQFLAGGAQAKNCALAQANAVKALFTQPEHQNGCLLTDLLIDFDADQQLYGVLQIADPKLKEKKETQIKNNHIDLGKQNDISGLALVLGAEDNQQAGDNALDPNSIKINLSDDLKKRLFDQNSTETLLSWFTDILRANNCSLLSFAQGAGLSTRQPYVLMCTQAEAKPLQKTPLKQTSKQATIDEILRADEEVFSYRHQGSLCERITFSQVETPNQYSIAMNFRVAAWMAQSSDSTLTSEAKLNVLDRKASIVNLFAQMMECEIDVLAHTWISPGIAFYIKGQGWNDGKYYCLECTHTLDNTNKFITHIKGIRIPPTSPDKSADQGTNATITGAKVATKTDTPTDNKSLPPVVKDATTDAPNKTDKTNYIIGDSLSILLDQSASKAEVHPKLSKVGWNVGNLLTALSSIEVYPEVNNVFMSIGTNDGFNVQPRMDTLIQSIKLKFPKAKIYAIPGSYGWGNNVSITPAQVTTFYDKFKSLGVDIMKTIIGSTPQHPSASTPTIIQGGKEIDAICNKTPIPKPEEAPLIDKSYKITGFERIEITGWADDTTNSTYEVRGILKTENMYQYVQNTTNQLISDKDLKEFVEKGILIILKRDGKEILRETVVYESPTAGKDIDWATSLGYFMGNDSSHGSIRHKFLGALPNEMCVYYNKILIQSVPISMLTGFTYNA